MVDKGPLLTSAIIFYLSIGAAIFQVLEEPNWKQAAAQYRERKERILEEYPCLSREDLDRILEVCCCEWMWCRRAGPDSECGCPAPAEEGSAAAQHSLKWNLWSESVCTFLLFHLQGTVGFQSTNTTACEAFICWDQQIAFGGRGTDWLFTVEAKFAASALTGSRMFPC